MSESNRYVLVGHSIVGKQQLTNFEFEPTRDHRVCLICGDVFQSPLDRLEWPSLAQTALAASARRRWAEAHAKTHNEHEHMLLRMSGRFCTPEALEKMVTLGIAPVSDMSVSDEHEHAGRQAPRAPIDDVEGPTKGGSSAFLRSDL